MDISTVAAAVLFAALVGQGGHQQDGFRDTGCEASAQVAVISERTGEVLYYNNSTCPAGVGSTDAVADEPAEENGDNGENGSE